MTPFEEEVKKALARCEPPDGFTDRLAARLAALPHKNAPSAMAGNWRWATAAALVVLLSGAAFQQEHQRERRGEAAKVKLLVALRITGSKLQKVQEQIQEVEREGKQ